MKSVEDMDLYLVIIIEIKAFELMIEVNLNLLY